MTPRTRDSVRRSLATLGIAAAIACGCAPKAAPVTADKVAVDPVTPVSVETIGPPAVFRATIQVTGTVRALDEVQLFSKVPGRLEKLMAREGDRVKTGQELALIERRTTEAQVRAAEAGMDVARAQLVAADAGLERASTEAQRLRSLFKDGSVTQQQLDGVETAHRSAVAQCDLAKAQISQFAAQLQLATIQLEECTIRAPLDGVVVSDFDHTVGEMIAPQVPVLHVADMSKVRVEVRLSEEELGNATVGRSATVSVARFPGREFAGVVEGVSPTIDVRSRTAKAEILVVNPVESGEYALKPGMFARASIVTAEQANALTVAESAIQTSGGERVAFVVADGRARKRAVKVGLSGGGRIVVSAGLALGEVVVTGGAMGLLDGTRVKAEEAARE
jgi:RND family efflux transporter MFP subunit